jgi:hypothetical protein
MNIKPKKQNTDTYRNFDYLNFLYSIGAVIILIGVIAKLLEWEVQDLFMTLGLSTEAVVFGISSVKFIKKQKSVDPPIETEDILEKPIIDKTDFESNLQSVEIYNPISCSQSNVENLPQFLVTPEANNLPWPPNLIDNINPDILWQLDEIGLISFPKDIFYQPEWLSFSEDKYNIITQLFLDLFGKKIVPKKYIAVLKSYNIRLPESGIGDLVIQNPTPISPEYLHILLLAFSPFRFKSFFDQFMIYTESDVIFIRTSKQNEIQIFGGESSPTLNYCSKYYTSFLIVSPNLDVLKPFIKFKNEILLDYLIKGLDVNNYEAFDLMTKILFHKKDSTKLYFIENLKGIVIQDSNPISFQFAKSIIYLLVSFNDKVKARSILNKLISFPINNNLLFQISEIVNVSAPIISINDTVSFQLTELFDDEYLNNCIKVQKFINKVITEKFVEEIYINDLFEISKIYTSQEIYKKYIQYIDKYEITPNSKQNSFSIQCKNVLK